MMAASHSIKKRIKKALGSMSQALFYLLINSLVNLSIKQAKRHAGLQNRLGVFHDLIE